MKGAKPSPFEAGDISQIVELGQGRKSLNEVGQFRTILVKYG